MNTTVLHVIWSTLYTIACVERKFGVGSWKEHLNELIKGGNQKCHDVMKRVKMQSIKGED